MAVTDWETITPWDWTVLELDDQVYPEKGIDPETDFFAKYFLSVFCVIDLHHHFLLLFLTKNWGRASLTSHIPSWCSLWGRKVSILRCHTWAILLYYVCVIILIALCHYNSECPKSYQWTIRGCLQIELCTVRVTVMLSSASLTSCCHTNFAEHKMMQSVVSQARLPSRE